MKTQTMTRPHSELGRSAAADRWMLAVGKRIDHRWLMEMSIGPRHAKPTGSALAGVGHFVPEKH